MNKFNVLFLIIFSLISINVNAQKEGNIWYFGKNLGLDFNEKEPKLLHDGAMNNFEGCSSIADADGNLLLYTDGISIWNSKHEIIKGGNDLNGNPSSTQSGIIVAKPRSKSLYFVFSVDAMENGLDGLEYAIVDITANNEKGEVIEKHNLLLTDATEKVTGVVHQNGEDVWILTHQWNTDAFYAFLITKDGLNKVPIISKVGSIHQGELDNSIGYLKAASNGGKLAIAIHEDKKFELFDFDNTTGIVSNPLTINVESGKPYGVEFSPNGKYLYTSTLFDGEIAQYDLSVNNPQETKVILRNGNGNNAGALQLAPNGKIYYQIYNSRYVGAIEKPNLTGEACSMNSKSITLGKKTARFGLPTFIQTYFTEENIDNKLVDITNEKTDQTLEASSFKIKITTKENRYKIEYNPSSEIIGKIIIPNVQVIETKNELNKQTNAEGFITFNPNSINDYQFTFSKIGYFNTTLSITKAAIEEKLKNSSSKILEFEVLMNKIYKNIEINLDNVYYDYDAANVQEKSLPVLENLVDLLQQNPEISIQLSAHTDCRGSESYNQKLSQKRAEFVVNYLISKGINPKRLKAKGYGESVPTINCDCKNCSKSQHQANRRTTFKVL